MRRRGTMGCPKLNLQVRATNADAAGFYRKLGYEVQDLISLGKLLRKEKRPH